MNTVRLGNTIGELWRVQGKGCLGVISNLASSFTLLLPSETIFRYNARLHTWITLLGSS